MQAQQLVFHRSRAYYNTGQPTAAGIRLCSRREAYTGCRWYYVSAWLLLTTREIPGVEFHAVCNYNAGSQARVLAKTPFPCRLKIIFTLFLDIKIDLKNQGHEMQLNLFDQTVRLIATTLRSLLNEKSCYNFRKKL